MDRTRENASPRIPCEIEETIRIRFRVRSSTHPNPISRRDRDSRSYYTASRSYLKAQSIFRHRFTQQQNNITNKKTSIELEFRPPPFFSLQIRPTFLRARITNEFNEPLFLNRGAIATPKSLSRRIVAI